MRKRVFYLCGVVVALFLVTWLVSTYRVKTVPIMAPGGVVPAFVADTQEEQARGLSGRSGLSGNQAMIFVFDENRPHGMWMKDMKFAIDIVWISDQRRVVDVQSDVLPSTYPEVFTPSHDARYVLELSAGKAEGLGIKPGVVLELPATIAKGGNVVD